MLQQEHRLKHDRDFDTLWKDGRFVGGNFLTLKYWKIDPARYPRRAYAPSDLRIGFVVSTKVSKRAVERNRVKRQMREVIRLLLKQGTIHTGYLIACIAKPAIIGKTYGEIEKEIIMVLTRGALLK
ncbi:MAG: ribonuclease P protein component [Patescibacteria group bacterium]